MKRARIKQRRCEANGIIHGMMCKQRDVCQLLTWLCEADVSAKAGNFSGNSIISYSLSWRWNRWAAEWNPVSSLFPNTNWSQCEFKNCVDHLVNLHIITSWINRVRSHVSSTKCENFLIRLVSIGSQKADRKVVKIIIFGSKKFNKCEFGCRSFKFPVAVWSP